MLEDGTRNPESIGFALENIAALLAHKLTSSEMLTRNRDTFVTAARRGPPQELEYGMVPAMGSQHEPLRVFVSYSRLDEAFLEQLQTHLKPLIRLDFIVEQDARLMKMGISLREQHNNTILKSNFIFLLVSADYLASDFIAHVELPAILRHHAAGSCQVMPIMLQPVEWKYAPFTHLQVFPKNGKAISTWAHQDEAWVEIVQELKRILAVGTPSVASVSKGS